MVVCLVLTLGLLTSIKNAKAIERKGAISTIGLHDAINVEIDM